MFIGYSDASVKNMKAYLAFVIVFEDQSIIRRRIVVNESDNNIAEALAIKELLSFLRYYNMKNGLILLDSNGVKNQLKKKGRQIHKYLSKDTKKTLRNLQIRTQVIPRKLNVAHKICYKDQFFESSPLLGIDRTYYKRVEGYPDLFLQLSAFEEYRRLFNKTFATFHEAQMKLNKKIWVADLVEDLDGFTVFQLHNKRIKVHGDTIVKITKVNYVQVGSHWRVARKKRRLVKILKIKNDFQGIF
ncbi:hypothetical protein [Neobacillus soli]|uniref:hypothetical protein n=1 Tax=Neobacillus soli TaxID=220688 RepID=UPI000824A1F8|nr:hypothetical protein [Neobacillus soli]